MTIGDNIGHTNGGGDNGGDQAGAAAHGRSAARFQAPAQATETEISLPPLPGSLSHSTSQGHTLRMEGTNVVRVPFGVRQPRRQRPTRPERWATLVLPFQLGGPTPTPPQAA